MAFSYRGVVRVAMGVAFFALGLGTGKTRADVPNRTVQPAQTFNVGTLKVERFGQSGRPIIFIPALYCGSWQWNGQVPGLVKSHAIYIVTLPGFDGRPGIQGDRLTDRAVSDIDHLIKAQHLRRPIIVGHSLGGTLAVLTGERYSNELGGVIAVEGGTPVAPTAAERSSTVEDIAKPFVGISQSAFPEALRTNQLQYVMRSKTDVEKVERLGGRSDPAAVVAWLRDALTLDLTPQLSQIHVPFVEIVPFDRTIDPFNGYKTFDRKRGAYTRWVAHAPNGKVIMIDNARHFVMFDQPATFNRALFSEINFLSS